MDDEDDSFSDSPRHSHRSRQVSTDDEIEIIDLSQTTPLRRSTPQTHRTIDDVDDDDPDEIKSDLGTSSPLLRLVQKYRRVDELKPQGNRRSPRINRRSPTANYANAANTTKHNSSHEAKFLSKCVIAEDEEEILDIKIVGLHVYELDDDLKEPESLHDVALYDNPRQPLYCFDGTLVKSDGTSQYVTGVSITRLAVDNLRDVEHGQKPKTSTAPIWLESETSAKHRAWYLIESASSAYETYFAPFVWLTKFTKYLIDYLVWSASIDQKIHLLDLENNFFSKLMEWHGLDTEFRNWHASCGGPRDFRRHLTCSNYAPFISGQAWNIGHDEDNEIRAHPVWDEVGLPLESRIENEKPCSEQTSVTTHAAECFLHSFPEWGPQGWDLFEVIVPDSHVRQWQSDRRQRFGLRDIVRNSSFLDVHDAVENFTKPFSRFLMPKDGKDFVGKVILVRIHHKCYCRPCACKEWRFAYVHGTDVSSGFEINVSWLLTPSKTACYGSHAGRNPRKKAKAFYPITNELFLDGEANKQTIPTSDVLKSFSVSVGSNDSGNGDIVYIYRAYHHGDKSFRVLDNTVLRHHVTKPPTADLDEEKVKVISIFSGAGLLDYGLKSGSNGLLEIIFAADINGEALKSLRANHSNAESCQCYHEDVNILFKGLCDGEMTLIDADCLAAGCSCKGFSKLNSNKHGVNAQRQCSLLAHTLAWVELLLPKMVIVENVPDMDSHAADQAKPTAAGQAISYLVSLGYQAKIVQIRASDFGGATNRERIFILATIPSIPLPDLAQPTGTNRNINSPPKTAAQVTRDLNSIKNNTSLNVMFPDHTPYERLEPVLEEFVALIPKTIPAEAKRMPSISSAEPYMNAGQRQLFEEFCEERSSSFKNTLRRIHPHRPFYTITTRWSLLDAWSYPKIHWLQNRTVSLLELRRYHGVPDDYILIGNKSSQLIQIGNSVAFTAASTIGKMLSTSWKKAYLRQVRSTHPRARPATHALHVRNVGVEQITNTQNDKLVLQLQRHSAVDRENEEGASIIDKPRLSKQNHRMVDSEDNTDDDIVSFKRPRLTKESSIMVIVPPSKPQANFSSSPNIGKEHLMQQQFDVTAGKPLVKIPSRNPKPSQHHQTDRVEIECANIIAAKSGTGGKPMSRAGSTLKTAIVIDDD